MNRPRNKTGLPLPAVAADWAKRFGRDSLRPTPEARHPDPSVRAAFSVLEMLGVIFILGFLLAMIFPALNRMQTAFQRRQAAAETRALAEAALHYRRIYNAWPPVHPDTRPGIDMPFRDFVFGPLPVEQDPTPTAYPLFDQALLISALSTTNQIANPRRIRFIDLPEKRMDAGGRLLDPWGQVYSVALDGNNDGQVAIEAKTLNAPEPAIVWSQGEPRSVPRPIRSWDLP